MPELKLIPVRCIGLRITGAKRKTTEASKRALAASIAEIGMVNPITVARPVDSLEGEQYQLIAGQNRLDAALSLGWETVPALITDLTEVDQEIWELDENLARAELTELERGEHLSRRKCLYEIKHPETKQHVAGGVAKAASAKSALAHQSSSFVQDAAAKTGISKRSVQVAIHRAESIAPEVKEVIRDMPEIADKGVELDALAAVPEEQQMEVVERVKSGEARTVREAITPEQKRACPTKEEIWWSTMTGIWGKGTDEGHARFHEWIHRQERA